MVRSRRALAPALAVAALLTVPAAGHTARTFGSLLKNSPANGPDPCVDTAPGPCTLVGYINPNDVGDPVTSPAPADGVIVLFRLRTSAAEPVTLRLATVTKQGDTLLAQAVRTGPTVTTQGTGEIEEFAARLVAHQGEHLALDAPAAHMVYNQGGNAFTPLYAPPLVEGQGPRGPGADPTGELLLQAVMEPDADGDGFGDETQDGCPTQPSTQGACDTTGPGVRAIFVGRRKVRYRLSEDATVTFRVQRARKTATGHTRYRTLRGRFTDDGTAGVNVRSLPRRFRAGTLADGSYRLVLRAVDAVGNATRKTKRFTVG
jgi:hypothetical protein